ncbi:copper chaperone for superoxide dismutase [Topomyia yanbarensis]|uniref:copper chaperone for superoxide dismutase n=1 Tax=Topomyia yanbarensis TaxID=2498891 RepID=UPI00273ACC4E|nr:copper chaperone for superoxide dismutase [Topomyia yanbarensis]XP_058838464.1 copper chaperone for superoxide dismutase [Topomyia yanbarensis]
MFIDFIKQLIFKQQKMTDRNCVKIEFAVQISGQKCVEKVRYALADVGQVQIDADKGSVLVETSLPWTEIQRKIEDTGRKAVLSGFGGQSAVSIVDHGNKSTGVRGVVRFCALAEQGVVVDGVIDGLEESKPYRLNVHECGDISDGCDSVGSVYNSSNINSDENGRATVRFVNKRLAVWDIIGRSVVIAESDEDRRLTCGIIARSAGIFENYKKICACDGVTIWDERDRPLAGTKRRDGQKSTL